MKRRRLLFGLLAAACIVAPVPLMAANRGPIRKLTYDSAAPLSPLFSAIADEHVTVRVSPANAYEAHVVVTNTTANPLTIAFPKAAVAVHILPQFGNGFLTGNGTGATGAFGNGTMSGFGQSDGAAQSVGGMVQGMTNIIENVNSPSPFAFGFPQIPAEKVTDELKQYGGLATIPAAKSILVQMKTVCLNYGRPEPSPRMTYQLVDVDQYTEKAALAELLESYTQRVDRDAMQAAAWHLANDLSWERLAQLSQQRVPGIPTPLFQRRDLTAAQALVQHAEQSAPQRKRDAAPTAIEVAQPDQRK